MTMIPPDRHQQKLDRYYGEAAAQGPMPEDDPEYDFGAPCKHGIPVFLCSSGECRRKSRDGKS